jgi:hypothetical protein
MWIARVVGPWQQTPDGHAPLLVDMLGPGDSLMDVTGQPVGWVPPVPNAATWEVWCSGATLDAIEADGRFVILWSEEQVDAGPASA